MNVSVFIDNNIVTEDSFLIPTHLITSKTFDLIKKKIDLPGGSNGGRDAARTRSDKNIKPKNIILVEIHFNELIINVCFVLYSSLYI